MNGGRISVDELDGSLATVSKSHSNDRRISSYRNAMQAPFDRLWSEALSSHMPPQGYHTLGGDVYVGFGLVSAQLYDLVRTK